jgi:DNA-binding response OmpR family regulator
MVDTPPRALVVDDDDLIRAYVRYLLVAAGWLVTEAVDGDEALALHRPGAFDLVVLDFAMPRRNGLDTLRALRLIDPDLPVLVASGTAATDVVHEALTMGRCAFLAKPFLPGEFRDAVGRTRRLAPSLRGMG